MNQLQSDEGIRLEVYDDATGKPVDWNAIRRAGLMTGFATIGIGRNLEARKISESEAKMLYFNDSYNCTQDVHEIYPDWRVLTRTRHDVLVGMCFNLGKRGLAGFKKMWKAIRAGDFDRAAAEIWDSDAARKLPDRYRRYMDIMRKGLSHDSHL